MQARWGDYPSLISMIEVTSFGYYYQETRSGRYVSITQNKLVNILTGFCRYEIGPGTAAKRRMRGE